MKRRFRHDLVYFLLKPFFRLFVKLRFNFKAKRFKAPKGIKGPYLILSNHQLAMDPFLLALSFKGPIYFVASDMIFSIKFWSKLIVYLVNPIPKTKYRSDKETVRDMIKIVKSKGTIGIFPEGNATFSGETQHIPSSIGKLIKLLKIPVIFYHIEGGALTKPRWSHHVRRGKVVGYVHKVFTYEAYKDLDVDTINELVKENLYVNDHALNETRKIRFKGKKLAEDIESSYFYCPNCGSFHTLYSNDNHVCCKHCTLNIVYTPLGTFEKTQQTTFFETTIPWYKAQEEALRKAIDDANDDEILFKDEDESVYTVMRSKQKTFIGKATIALSKLETTLYFLDKTITLKTKDLLPSVQQKNKLILYDKATKTTYYLLNHKKRNALKYVLAINYLVEKGDL
ncbi:MAG: lysophospholipid acyltransferase family protein [Candidatus Izemoplasmataceae bacterium]